MRSTELRRRWILRISAIGFSALLASACATPAERVSPDPPSARAKAPEGFDAQKAWEDLAALTRIGPRATGTPGGEAARSFLRGRLGEAGLEVQEGSFALDSPQRDDRRPGGASNGVHLRAVIPGTSPDLVLLVASYDTPPGAGPSFTGANSYASGAAVVLELARQLARDPLPYTTWIVLLDAEAARSDTAERPGSRALARMVADEDLQGLIRLAVVFSQVGDAELTLDRDLLSHRLYRETFWKVARRLGYTAAFPPDSAALTLETSHRSLIGVGVRNVVALSDVRYGGNEPPGVYWNTDDDTLEHCDPASLEAVGRVSLEALREISELLLKVDRFAAGPERRAAERESP